ncbi:hypothetical protein GZ77_10840 [Endozoicomonas montiporae]|uniref:Uncharacterized protein n=2 Tax=Endozoicomonas montiporae TaxID=1027273 RepID=A0A081N8K2_9GAMM|nr:hypothetical protein GZ77_10840 [Endozoicomonas montiporae]
MLLGFEKQANRHFITDNFGRKKVQTRIDIFERAAQRLTELMPLEANPPEGGVTNVSEVGINSVATDSGSRNSEVFEPSDDDDEEFYREDDQGQENRADELMYLFEESQKQLKRAKDDCQKLLDENALISAKLGVIDAANKHHSHTIKRLREESKFLRDDKKRLEHERDSYKAMANAAQQKIDAVARIVTPSNPAASGNGAMGVCWQHSPRK